MKKHAVSVNWPCLGKSDRLHRAPKFDDPYKERSYWKGRLAAAFRIFAKYGFDEGVAGECLYTYLDLESNAFPHPM